MTCDLRLVAKKLGSCSAPATLSTHTMMAIPLRITFLSAGIIARTLATRLLRPTPMPMEYRAVQKHLFGTHACPSGAVACPLGTAAHTSCTHACKTPNSIPRAYSGRMGSASCSPLCPCRSLTSSACSAPGRSSDRTVPTNDPVSLAERHYDIGYALYERYLHFGI
jgi:hypothetical protein